MHARSRFVALSLGALAWLAAGVGAQAPAPPAPSPPPCSTPEHRQFDFWLGDWNVEDGQGRAAGTNLITREYGGCVLVEHWRSAAGPHAGSSFNIYDPPSGKWYQTWVDNGGLLLVLSGGLQDGKMLLTGDKAAANGGTVQHRISFEKLKDGRLRQFWQVSRDQGRTWVTAFEGYYRRK